jgi:AraC family transcriptional regulator
MNGDKNMNFEKKIVETEKAALIKHVGTVEEMGLVLEKLMKWVSEENVKVIGAPFSLYYTDPSMVEPDEMVYDMGIPIANDVEGNNDIKIKEIPKHTVISSIHKGKYTTLTETYMGIWQYIEENKYVPNGVPKEIYLNNPQEVSPEELLTEVQFPIKE